MRVAPNVFIAMFLGAIAPTKKWFQGVYNCRVVALEEIDGGEWENSFVPSTRQCHHACSR